MVQQHRGLGSSGPGDGTRFRTWHHRGRRAGQTGETQLHDRTHHPKHAPPLQPAVQGSRACARELPRMTVIDWQGLRESNSSREVQILMCCRYTKPQFVSGLAAVSLGNGGCTNSSHVMCNPKRSIGKCQLDLDCQQFFPMLPAAAQKQSCRRERSSAPESASPFGITTGVATRADAG